MAGDAFADLFKSAAGSLSSSVNSAPLKKAPILPKAQNSSNTWNNLDIFNTSTSRATSYSPTPTSQTDPDDPFAIFNTPTSVSNSHLPFQATDEWGKPEKSQSISNGTTQSVSLLDDDFMDAFTEEPEVRSEPVRVAPSRIESPRRPSPIKSQKNPTDSDNVLAELVDIGFSVQVSNNAIARVGPDLQACVNFIMSGEGDQAPRAQPQHDVGTTINDLSTDFLNKASIFFNKSKKTVLKNIEQLQQNNRSRKLPLPETGLPAWMKDQHVYKKDALEKKYGGEDYGSDEENINQDDIRRFMEIQRRKDQERKARRAENIKQAAREKLSGKPASRDESHGESPSMRQAEITRTSRANSPAQHQPSQHPPKQPWQEAPRQTVQQPAQPAQPVQEVDLLGLGLSSLEPPSMSVGESPTHRSKASTPGTPRLATNEPLNAFAQSDYETSKTKATDLFKQGDYESAHISYIRALEALPATHELRIVVLSNLALTSIKRGNYKEARDYSTSGLDLIGPLIIDGWVVNDKPIKYWYVRLLGRKAESLENLEQHPQALECYLELIKQGVTDKKTLDAKRRIKNIVDPPEPVKVVKPKPTVQISVNNDAIKRMRQQDANEKQQEEQRLQLHDEIQARLAKWSNGKEDNLRTLLVTLPEIIPSRLGFPFVTTNVITIGDLMLPKKVKINYMKVISAIHPDKLRGLKVEDMMVCQGVFVVLNKSWDLFKEQNGLN